MPSLGRLVLALIMAMVAACGSSTPPIGTSGPTGTPSANETSGVPAASGTPQASPTDTRPTASTAPGSLPPLPDTADLAALPAPAPLADGVPMQQSEALADAIDEATSAEERLPLVMTALLGSGIPILDVDGSPVEFDPQPSGIALEAWQVHALAAVDPGHAQIAFGDLAELLFTDEPADAQAFSAALSLDLRTAAFAADPSDQRWGWTVTALDPRNTIVALSESEKGNMNLGGLQVALILQRLAGDLWRDSLAEQGGAGVKLAAVRGSGPGQRPREPRNAPLPCRYAPTEEKIVFVSEEAGSRVAGKLIEYLGDKGVSGMGALGKAGMVADLVKFLAPYLLLKIDFELSNPPLVRTKSTSQPGEQRQLAATLRFDTGNLQLINCFRLMFASLGFTFSLPEDGPLGNGSVSWEPRHGFERVRFYGGDTRLAQTDGSGIAIIGIEGIPQKVAVPTTAGRVNTTASVFLVYRVKELSLGGDLYDAVTALVDSQGNPGQLALKAALEGIQRAKWSSASFEFPVVDWGERWQTEIVIEERSSTGSIYFQWTGIMGVDSDGIVVGDGMGVVTIIGKLCEDIPPDGHSEAVDWRIDGEHTFKFDGYKEGDVLNVLLPNTGQAFRQVGDAGPCQFDAAFKQAGAQTTLVVMGQNPIQLRAEPGTQSIPFGEGTTLTIRMEPVSD